MERSFTYDVIKEMQFKTTVSYHYTPFRIVKIWKTWNTDNTKCWKIRALSHCLVQFSSVHLLSRVRLFATPWTAAHEASLSITNTRRLLKLKSIASVMPSNHLILRVPFSSCLQSFPASGSLQMSQFFTSGGQIIGASASVLALQMNIQD